MSNNLNDTDKAKQASRKAIRTMVITGALSLGGLALLVLCIRVFPPHIGRIVLILLITVAAGGYSFWKYFQNRTSFSPDAASDEEQQRLYTEEADLEQVEFSQSVQEGVKTILLLDAVWGRPYQCISASGQFCFVRLGDPNKPNTSEVVTDFHSDAGYLKGKNDFAVPKSFETKIKLTLPRPTLDGNATSGNAVISVSFGKTRKNFAVVSKLDEQTLTSFFLGADVTCKQSRIRAAQDLPDIDENAGADKVNGLRLAYAVMNTAAAAAGSCLLFADVGRVFHIVFSVLIAALFIAYFVLYIAFPDVFTLADFSNNAAANGKKKKIHVFFPMVAISLAFMLYLFFNRFSFLGYLNAVIWSISIAAVLVLLFVFLTKEYKKRISSFFMFLVLAVFFAPTAILTLNATLDTTDPVLVSSAVYEMRISKDSDSGDSYYITIQTSAGKKKELEIMEDYYLTLSLGDTVTVKEYAGFFRIPFAFIAHP